MSSNLFQLVKSLNQTEKRYFKTFDMQYGQKESNNYLKLFNLIEQQETYNEALLLSEIEDESFKKNFPTKKNYLYHILLKSLRNYHSGQSARIKVRELYVNAIILDDRELKQQAIKMLEKAKKIALRYHLNNEYLIIVLFQRRIYRDFIGKNWAKNAEDFSKEAQESLSAIQEEIESIDYYEKVHYYARIADNLTVELESTYNEFESISKNHTSKDIYSFERKNFNHYNRVLYFRHKKDYKKVADSYAYLLQYFDNHPHMVNEYPIRYIGILNNNINFHMLNGKFEKIKEIIEKIKNIPYPNSHIKTTNLNTLYYAYMVYYMSTHDYVKMQELAPKVWKFLAKSKNRINDIRRMTFYQNFAYALFMNKNYDDALKWVEVVLKEFDHMDRPDVSMSADRLEILIHFELNNDFLADYRIRSANRKYSKTKLKEFREHLKPTLKCLKTILNSPLAMKKELLIKHYEELPHNRYTSDVVEWLRYRMGLPERRK
jgi:hypothetical protein